MMPGSSCAHSDIRDFDGLRCCLACGEVVFETTISELPVSTGSIDTQKPFQYTDLNYKLGQEIRLVVLLPGEAADPIRIEIVHVDLEDEPQYDAVSYTWATEAGDASLSELVQCVRGGSIKVTKNCGAALRQLRQRGLRRRVWIDTLCINQTNIDERNHQVYKMDKIYAQARSVRICIQDRSATTQFSDYGRIFHWLQDDDSGGSTDVESELFPTLVHLVSLRYFHRVWAIQEVAFARAAYLLVNTHELLLTNAVMERIRLVCQRNRYNLPGVLRWNPGYSIEADILTCLRAGIDCKATDERDKVYAVLSLMEPQARSLIPVDYSLSVEAVYTNAVIAIMTTERNLDVLSYASVFYDIFQDFNSDPNMSVEQLRDYLIDKTTVKQQSPSTDASAAVKSPRINQFGKHDQIGLWRSTIEVKMVSATAYHSDEYKEDCRFCIISTNQPPRKDVLPRFRVRAHYIDSVNKTTLYRTFRDAKRFAETVSKDASLLMQEKYSWILPVFMPQDRPVIWNPKSIIPANQTLVDSEADLPHCNFSELLAFIEDAKKGAGKELFLTNFSVGFATPRLWPGDSIFAIDGLRTPLVLRKGSTEYRVISECYLWGALDLTCWDPVTKKGRWGVNDKEAKGKQMRMIEICRGWER